MLDNKYCAGFVDGEGCISLTGRFDRHGEKRYVTPIVQIANINREILEMFKEKFGGSISDRHEERLNRRPSFAWMVCGTKAMSFLEQVYPYLIIKKKQADIVMGLKHSYNKNLTPEIVKDRESRWNEIRQLNRRGVIHYATS